MRKNWNNKGRTTLFFLLFALCSTLLALCYLLHPDNADSGPYLDSAHGNTSYGVNRSSLSTFGYSTGNCAHCHEQHTSIGGSEPAPNSPAGPDYYLLFKDLWVTPIQSNVFCFGCHIENGSYQSSFQRTNYSYSYWKGGDTSLTCPDSIYESFQFIQSDTGASQTNCGSSVGSSHMFLNFTILIGKWGFSSTSNYINPCSACHNPHKAKRDFPCSRPSEHTDKYTWNVWGDDSSERMNAYTTNYWAPKRVGGGYEPDGSLTQDGSNMPDYVTLCTDCHNSTTTINSTQLGRNLYKINWGVSGDFHGGRQRIDDGGDFSGTGEFGDLMEPYKVSGSYPRTNYVLSCTDCHEPHGSHNEFLLRKAVNGTSGTSMDINGNGLWYNWCQTCHSFTTHLPPLNSSTNCFQSGACHRHCDGTACSSNNLF